MAVGQEKPPAMHNGSPDFSASPHPDEKKITYDPEFFAASGDFSHIDSKKVLRKMDMRLIPMLALLYLLAFLDRGNIGNARIEGLDVDLKLTGGQYNWTCGEPIWYACCVE